MIFRRAAGLGQALLKCREIIQIFRGGPRDFGNFKAGQTMPNISGIADFAHLAVANHIDAGPHLLFGRFPHGAAHHAVKFGFVIIAALILREELVNDDLRARQTANVGGQNTFGAGFHHIPALF